MDKKERSQPEEKMLREGVVEVKLISVCAGGKDERGGRWEREQKQRKKCGMKSRRCAVLKHTYRPVLSDWEEAVHISTVLLTPFA